MTLSDDENESLAQFIESEVLFEISDAEEEKNIDAAEADVDEPKAKKMCLEKGSASFSSDNNCNSSQILSNSMRIESGIFSKIPPEIFPHILKFLSSEDLIACSMVCRFLNYAASDESLWRHLYRMRWGLLPPTKNLRECAWKKLYIQKHEQANSVDPADLIGPRYCIGKRDEEDMAELVRNCPADFKEYYIQMQAAKRSQAPLPSQVKDDRIIMDKTVGDQVSIWKRSKGLTDTLVVNHTCSGETCTYHQIGNVFVCEKTGYAHVCDDTCREVVMDPANELLVCKISGHCFDRLLSPSEMEPDYEQQGVVTDEAEPFMGSGRFARAYLLGYNCADEKELEDALKFF